MSPLVAQASLKLTVLLPQSPECWDYRHQPPYLTIFETFICLIVLEALVSLGFTDVVGSDHTIVQRVLFS
jgi:hypothetical protein